MQDEEMRCVRCGAIVDVGMWWQLNVDGKPVCERCVRLTIAHVNEGLGAYE
jgi:hypothetical protein